MKKAITPGRGTAAAEVAGLERHRRFLEVPEGHLLAFVGEPATNVYKLVSGELEIIVPGKSQCITENPVIALREQRSAIVNGVWTANVLARSDARVIQLDLSSLIRVAEIAVASEKAANVANRAREVRLTKTIDALTAVNIALREELDAEHARREQGERIYKNLLSVETEAREAVSIKLFETGGFTKDDWEELCHLRELESALTVIVSGSGDRVALIWQELQRVQAEKTELTRRLAEQQGDELTAGLDLEIDLEGDGPRHDTDHAPAPTPTAPVVLVTVTAEKVDPLNETGIYGRVFLGTDGEPTTGVRNAMPPPPARKPLKTIGFEDRATVVSEGALEEPDDGDRGTGAWSLKDLWGEKAAQSSTGTVAVPPSLGTIGPKKT